MTMLSRLVLVTGFLLSNQIQAVTCYITIVKDTCWTEYNVNVVVTDANTGKALSDLTVFEGKSWQRQEFSCTPGQTIALTAKFSPEFWAGDEHKTFPGQRYWKLPDKIKPGDIGWNVTVCFPKYFSDVPTPPHATSNCRCEVDKIPTIDVPKV